jgi:hypothetical protein
MMSKLILTAPSPELSMESSITQLYVVKAMMVLSMVDVSCLVSLMAGGAQNHSTSSKSSVSN